MDPAALMTAQTILQTGEQVSSGIRRSKALEFESKVADRQAQQRMARGTQEAALEARAGREVLSDARAAMAASGGVASDPGALRRLSKIGQQSEYNVLSAIYDAETESDMLKVQGEALRRRAKEEKTAGIVKGLTTAISGGSKIYEEFYRGPRQPEIDAMNPEQRARYEKWKAKPWYKRGRYGADS